jgi:ribosomal protein S16
MLTLRFQRQGKKRDFIFRIVAVDSKVAINSGKSKEILGWWDPRINKFELKKERILYWISQGAQPSDSCYNLLVRAKIIEGKKRPITIRKKKEKKVKVETGEKIEQASAAEEKPEEKVEKAEEVKPEEKVEEKVVEETKGEVKPEEKAEEKPEEKVEEKKEEKKEVAKEEIKKEPKVEEVKEKKEETEEVVKEKPKEDIKEKVGKEKAPEEKTEK